MNDELFKALGIFQQSVQSAAVNQGIMNATKQVDMINQSTLGALEKRQQQSQLANQLAMQLSGLGASGTQIQTAVGAVAPPQIKDSNDAYQLAATTGDPGLMKLSKDMQSFEMGKQKAMQDDSQEHDVDMFNRNAGLQKELAGLKSGVGLKKEDRKFLRDFQDAYTKDVRDFKKVQRQFVNARDLIMKNSPMAASALRPLLARASGEVGNLSETEQKAWEGRQDIKSKIERVIKTGATSTLTAGDRKAILDIIGVYEKNANMILNDFAGLHSKQAASLLGADEEEVGSVITGGTYKKRQDPQQQKPAADSGASGSWEAPAKKNLNKYFE